MEAAPSSSSPSAKGGNALVLGSLVAAIAVGAAAYAGYKMLRPADAPPKTEPLESCESVTAAQSPWKLAEPAKEESAAQDEDCVCCTPRNEPRGIAQRKFSKEFHDHGHGHVHGHVHVHADSDSDADTHTPSLYSEDEDSDEGHQQSPIDICESDSELVPRTTCPNAVTINMNPARADLVYNGKGFSIQWRKPTKNSVVIGGKVFNAVQFHFHTPSEHTLDHVHEAMELHMVHQAADGTLAVIGVLFREGKENPFLAQFWDKLDEVVPGKPSKTKLGKIDPRVLDILAESFYRYKGSLTTPPYTEGVEWIVMHDVFEVSKEQIEMFHHVIPGSNARDLQPLYKRHVWLACHA